MLHSTSTSILQSFIFLVLISLSHSRPSADLIQTTRSSHLEKRLISTFEAIESEKALRLPGLAITSLVDKDAFRSPIAGDTADGPAGFNQPLLGSTQGKLTKTLKTVNPQFMTRSMKGFTDEIGDMDQVLLSHDSSELKGLVNPRSSHTTWYPRSRYQAQWKSIGLDADLMRQTEMALGIQTHSVRPIGSDQFIHLELYRIRSKQALEVEQTQALKRQALVWYQNPEILSCFSEEHQTILAFNLDLYQRQRQPWWKASDVDLWYDSKMPWRSIIQVGNILKIGDLEPMLSKDVQLVRKQILNALKTLASHTDLEASLSEILQLHSISDLLRQVSAFNPSLTRFDLPSDLPFSNYDLKLKSISPTPTESLKLKHLIKNGELDLPLHQDFKDLIDLHLLLLGISPQTGSRYLNSLKTIHEASSFQLTNGNPYLLKAMKDLLPITAGGHIKRVQTFYDLDEFFNPILDKKYVLDARTKAILLNPINQLNALATGFLSSATDLIKTG